MPVAAAYSGAALPPCSPLAAAWAYLVLGRGQTRERGWMRFICCALWARFDSDTPGRV